MKYNFKNLSRPIPRTWCEELEYFVRIQVEVIVAAYYWNQNHRFEYKINILRKNKIIVFDTCMRVRTRALVPSLMPPNNYCYLVPQKSDNYPIYNLIRLYLQRFYTVYSTKVMCNRELVQSLFDIHRVKHLLFCFILSFLK